MMGLLKISNLYIRFNFLNYNLRYKAWLNHNSFASSGDMESTFENLKCPHWQILLTIVQQKSIMYSNLIIIYRFNNYIFWLDPKLHLPNILVKTFIQPLHYTYTIWNLITCHTMIEHIYWKLKMNIILWHSANLFRHGTWFGNSNLTEQNILWIVWHFVHHLSEKQCKEYTKIGANNDKIVVKYYRKCQIVSQDSERLLRWINLTLQAHQCMKKVED